MENEEGTLVCRTRDISNRGCFLGTALLIPQGTRVVCALLDEQRGIVLELQGEIARCLPPGPDGLGRGVGVRFDQPPPEWTELVESYQREFAVPAAPKKRMRVLVIGDRERQRAALALYVTSGWDIRFAPDLESAQDALSGVELNAVIAEGELDDDRWKEVLDVARTLQPRARRIVRSSLLGRSAPQSQGPHDLFHRVVDRDAGLDALVDALTADLPQ